MLFNTLNILGRFVEVYYFCKTITFTRRPSTSSTGRAAAHNVFQENPGPLGFANGQCGLVLDSFLLYIRPSRLKTIRNSTNTEDEHVYGSNRKALD